MGKKNKLKTYIRTWEQRCYMEGIPDEAPRALEAINLVPSYRKIAAAILKNDHHLISLGFPAPKREVYNQLKIIEIKERNEKLQNR